MFVLQVMQQAEFHVAEGVLHCQQGRLVRELLHRKLREHLHEPLVCLLFLQALGNPAECVLDMISLVDEGNISVGNFLDDVQTLVDGL